MQLSLITLYRKKVFIFNKPTPAQMQGVAPQKYNYYDMYVKSNQDLSFTVY